MNIYFMASKDTFDEKSKNELAKFGQLIFLDAEGGHEILNNDLKEKVIIYDPDYAGWNFPENIITDIKNIKAIFLGTTDKSYINLEICNHNNILVFNIPRYASNSVAEYLFMYMFALAKKIPLQIKNNNQQVFSNDFLQMELQNKNVGIVGLGNIGTRIAEMCYGIGMNISYWNRTSKENQYRYLELDELFKNSDVIFICLSINEETKHLITNAMLQSMKKDCILISSTGKQLFDIKIIEEKIKNKELYGYGFEDPNPEINNYVGNAMITSEYGWFTKEASDLRIKKWTDTIIDYFLHH